MYHYVEDKLFERKAKKFSSELVKKVELDLRETKDINSQAFLVGSGGRNMITQNENGPIDFDYNLNIISYTNWNDAKQLKELVRKSFNKIMKSYNLVDVSDSTACLATRQIYFEDRPKKFFSIDLAIVKMDGGFWHRLIHKKTGNTKHDEYIWNKIKNSNDIKKKSDFIKSNNYWEDVRNVYLSKKNFYLREQDEENHPSFVCFIEAVNEIYQKLKLNH